MWMLQPKHQPTDYTTIDETVAFAVIGQAFIHSQEPTNSPTLRPVPNPTATPGNPTRSPTSGPPTASPTEASCESIREKFLNELPADPILTKASFSSTGAAVTFLFNGPTDQMNIETGIPFACSRLLSFPTVEAAECQWTNEGEVYADVSAAFGILPDIDVELISNVLYAKCPQDDLIYGHRCECLEAASASITVVEPPDPPLVPVPIIQGPTLAAACEGFTLDTSQSSGGGGREFTWYAWDVELDFSDSTPTSVENATLALDTAKARIGESSTFSLLGSESTALASAGVVGLKVTLTLRNFLLGEALSDEFSVELTTEAVPSLQFVGGLQQFVARPAILAIRVNAIATSCDDRPLSERSVSYTWQLDEINDEGALIPTGLTSTSTDPRQFKLEPYSLTAGSTYTLSVTVTDDVLGVGSSTAAELVVIRSAVVALIDGGDRVVPFFGRVEIIASPSYDEDVADLTGVTAGLSFYWTCQRLSAGLHDCTSAFWEQRESEVLDINGQDLGSGVFSIAVNVTSIDGRLSSAAVRIEVVNDDPPRVSLGAIPTRVTVAARLVLLAECAPSSLDLAVSEDLGFNSTWRVQSALAGGRGLEEWATTETHLVTSAQTRRHDLVVPSGALVSGATYTFVLEAALEEGSSRGSASITVVVARPPSAGIVNSEPQAGFALETRFQFSTSYWVAEDLPLSYEFLSLQSNGQSSTLRGPTRQTSLAGVVLPAGTPNISIVVVAHDTIGGEGKAARSVRVSPTNLVGEALFNSTATLLVEAQALESNEGICQTAVAASQASANDTTLITTLVSAVSTVVANQDSDPNLVGQTASALLSTTAGGSVEKDAAAVALDATTSMATTSAAIGIKDNTASSLVGTLSSLLTTDLFSSVANGTSTSHNARVLHIMPELMRRLQIFLVQQLIILHYRSFLIESLMKQLLK